MESFLDKHLSLANKNNIIKIIYSSKKTDDIFSRTVSESMVSKIIQNTKSLHNKVTFKNYNMNVFYKGNEKFIVSNGELVYIISNIDEQKYDNNLLITKETILKDEYVIPSHSDYDYVENLEVLEISVVSCFNVYVMKDKDTSKKYVEIVISKPNNVDKIYDFINQIIKK